MNATTIPNPDPFNFPGTAVETLEVTATGKTVCNLEVGFYIEKDYIGDLVINITSPSGTSVIIMQQPGCNNAGPESVPGACSGCTDLGFAYMVGSSGNSAYIADAGTDDSLLVEGFGTCPVGPIGGTSLIYRPLQPLSDFNGEDPEGTWTLTVYDYFTDGNDEEGLLDCFFISGGDP